MKKTVLTYLLLVAAMLALPACGLAVPSKQDALEDIRRDETALEIARIEADGRIEAAKIAAEAQRDAAGLQATAVAESAAVQAAAMAQAILAAGSGSGAEMMATSGSQMLAIGGGECAVKAVDLIAAWVTAGAPDGNFDFAADDSSACQGVFADDIQPLFSENNVWFEGSQACTGCHFGNTENSYHEMSLASHEGVLLGGDVLSAPPGVSILGESAIGAGDFSWDASKLRERLRNNRMPPGWEFDITETNRDGPCLDITADGVSLVRDDAGAITYGCDMSAVGLIGAWVSAGAPETEPFDYGDQSLTFARDVQPFFTQPDMWFAGSQACTGCHFGNSENSYHEMDLSSYQGILLGGDVLSSPPGVPILGQSEVGAADYDWDHSKLRARLRNNRMAPGIEFDITEENRDGPIILAGTALTHQP